MPVVTEGSEVPELGTPEQYADFMKGPGSNIKPGSDAEKAVRKGFRGAKELETAGQQSARQARIQDELDELKATKGVGTYIRPEESQDIHRDGEPGAPSTPDIQTEIGQLDADIAAPGSIAPRTALELGHGATSHLVSRPPTSSGIQGPQRAEVNPPPPVNIPLQMGPRGL